MRLFIYFLFKNGLFIDFVDEDFWNGKQSQINPLILPTKFLFLAYFSYLFILYILDIFKLNNVYLIVIRINYHYTSIKINV